MSCIGSCKGVPSLRSSLAQLLHETIQAFECDAHPYGSLAVSFVTYLLRSGEHLASGDDLVESSGICQ